MNLLGRAAEKSFWQEVREKDCFKQYRETLLYDYEELMKEMPLKALKYSEFKMFFVNGNRSVYEKSYTTHGLALTVPAILALIYPEEDKYLEVLMDAIYTACDEYTWCLPAHQPKFEENNNCHIDLCTSAMAFRLAEIDALLGDRLDPLIRSRIRAEVERRVFKPFRENQPYSWWETGHSNWTAVCMGSVACAFMYLLPDEARELLPRFEKSMAGFLCGFSDEGVCLEGGGYWNYGFGNFLFYADLVRTFTDGEINYFAMPKVKKIATFYQKIFLTERVVANFADCGECGGFVIGRMHYIKKEYPDEMKSTGVKYSSFSRTYEFPTRLREALWFYPEDEAEVDDHFYSEFYAESAQWLIKRTPSYGFAAKGGDNAEFHNHNDIGHFIFAKDGKQILCDIGSGVYTKQYFSPERYEIIEPSARSHSVPIIDGELQCAGKEFAARDTKYENGVFSLDIAGAYQNLDKNDKILRSFEFTDTAVKLTDKFEFSSKHSVTERLVSKIDPDISTQGVILIDGVKIRYDGDIWDVSKSSEISSVRNTTCYMIDFVAKCDVTSFEVTVGE